MLLTNWNVAYLYQHLASFFWEDCCNIHDVQKVLRHLKNGTSFCLFLYTDLSIPTKKDAWKIDEIDLFKLSRARKCNFQFKIDFRHAAANERRRRLKWYLKLFKCAAMCIAIRISVGMNIENLLRSSKTNLILCNCILQPPKQSNQWNHCQQAFNKQHYYLQIAMQHAVDGYREQ